MLSLHTRQVGTFLTESLRLLLWAAIFVGAADPLIAQDRNADEETFSTRIFLSNVDGTGLKPLANLPEYGSQGSPDWSSVGRKIALDAWRPGKGENGSQARIVVVNADGTNPVFFGDGAMPSFSPKGNRIAYSRYGKGVWVLNANDPDEAPALLDEGGWGTDWSPDGTRIAYTRGGNIVIFDLVEGTTQSLFEGQPPFQQIYWNFVWSPDSNFIAFRARKRDGKTAIFTVSAEGSKQGLETIHEGPGMEAMAWNPDTRQILIALPCVERNNLLQFYAYSPKPGPKPELQTWLPADRRVQDPSFSPDGKRLAFSAHKRTPAAAK